MQRCGRYGTCVHWSHSKPAALAATSTWVNKFSRQCHKVFMQQRCCCGCHTLVTSHLSIGRVQCLSMLICDARYHAQEHPVCTFGTCLLNSVTHQVAKHVLNVQDYIRELGMLLVHLGDRGDPSTQASMEHLTLESTQLLGCLKAFNPSVYKMVSQQRLDGANTVPAQEPDLSWFMSLPASRQISCCPGVCSVCYSRHYLLCHYPNPSP